MAIQYSALKRFYLLQCLHVQINGRAALDYIVFIQAEHLRNARVYDAFYMITVT